MRAAIFKSAHTPLEIEHIEDPTPARTEAVIQVGRCGICGSDISMTSGCAMDYPHGTILGHEYAGEVVAVGQDVEYLRPGDRITALPAQGCGSCPACLSGYPLGCRGMSGMLGGFGEYLRVAESSAIKLPSALSLADGALVEPLAVGLRGVALAEMAPCCRVLVLGAGSVGLAALYWARHLGAGKIVAASPSARRRDIALAMGADAFETLGEDESERINAALGGPPDLVLECAGASGVLGKAIELVRPGGTIVSLGFCTSPDPIVPAIATWKRVTMKFSLAYTLADFEHAADMLDRGHVEPRLMISDTIGLDSLPAMFEALRGGAPQTKVHVEPWQM